MLSIIVNFSTRPPAPAEDFTKKNSTAHCLLHSSLPSLPLLPLLSMVQGSPPYLLVSPCPSFAIRSSTDFLQVTLGLPLLSPLVTPTIHRSPWISFCFSCHQGSMDLQVSFPIQLLFQVSELHRYPPGLLWSPIASLSVRSQQITSTLSGSIPASLATRGPM